MRAIEDVGNVPSIRPVAEETALEVASRAQTMAQSALNEIASVRAAVAGVESKLETKIKEAVETATLPIRTTLKGQNDALGQLLTYAEEAADRDRKKKLDSIHDVGAALDIAAKEQKVFDGKGRRARLWIKSSATLLFILVVIGSALGINRCNHVHGIELPE